MKRCMEKMMLLEDSSVIDYIDFEASYIEISSRTGLVQSKEELVSLLKSNNKEDKEIIVSLIPPVNLRYIFSDYFYSSSYKFKTQLYSKIYKDMKNNDHNVDMYFLSLINLVNFIIKNKSNEFYKDFFKSNLTDFEKRVIMQFCWTHYSNEALKKKLKELDIFMIMMFHSELFYGEPDSDIIRKEIEFAYHKGY